MSVAVACRLCSKIDRCVIMLTLEEGRVFEFAQ